MDKDISNNRKAVILTLHFIGSGEVPKWIDPLTYEMCRQVFHKNRGKFEDELHAVKEVIDERYQDQKGYNS